MGDELDEKKLASLAASARGLVGMVAEAKGMPEDELDGVKVFKMIAEGDETVREILRNISIQQKGGITETELPKISERIKNEMEKDYPEATMWGCLPAKGFFVRHARNVQFHNVQILTEEADVRPDFLCDDVE